MKDLKKIQEFFSKPLNEYSDENFDSLEDAIANSEFGMDYNQLGPGEKEWVRDEMSMNEMDINDPVLMRMRAAKNAKPDFGKEYGDAVKKARSGSNNDTKLRFLKKERAQLMRDMEQEAEPEGGPIADEYGSKLNRIDAAIAKLSGVDLSNLTYAQAKALDEDQTYSSTFGGSSKKLDGRKIKMEIVKSGYDIIPTDIWNRILVGKDGKRVGMVNTDEGYYNVDGKMYKWKGTPDFIDHIDSQPISEISSKSDQLKTAYDAFEKAEMSGDIRGQELALAVIDLINGDIKEELSPEDHLQIVRSMLVKAEKDGDDDLKRRALADMETVKKIYNLKEAIGGSHVFQYFANRGYVVKDRRPDGYPKKEGVEGFQVTDRKDSGRRSDNPQTVIFQYNKDTDQFTISQMNGYKIDELQAIKAGMKQRGSSWAAGIDSYITGGNYNPVNISAEGLIDIVDHVMGGLSREAKAQKDFYADRGPTSGTIDEKEDKNQKPLSKPIAKDLGKMKTNFNDLKKRLKLESLNPEVSNALNRFIKAMAKRYNYSEQDAVYAIMAALKQRDFDGLNEDTRQDLGIGSSVSKRRAKAELKNPGNDGSKVYGLDKDGKRVHIKNINDVDKFKKFELDADLNESVVEKVIAQIKEEKPGLWANIRAKKARGGKPAHGNSNAHKTAVKAGKKINKLNENGEDQFSSELDGFADKLAAEIKNELEDHKEEIQKSDKELNEAAVTVGIIGYILLSNTVANMLSKFAKNQFAKHNFGKGEEAAKKIYDFTHKNEEAFKAPIRRIVGIFTKDEKKKKMISDILYAIVIFLMAGQAGGEAVAYLKKASYLKGGIYGLKAAIKGTEVATILKGAVSDAVS